MHFVVKLYYVFHTSFTTSFSKTKKIIPTSYNMFLIENFLECTLLNNSLTVTNTL